MGGGGEGESKYKDISMEDILHFNWLSDCLTPTLSVFQLYCGVPFTFWDSYIKCLFNRIIQMYTLTINKLDHFIDIL